MQETQACTLVTGSDEEVFMAKVGSAKELGFVLRNVQIRPETWRRLHSMAAKRGVPIFQFHDMLLERQLNRLEREEAEKTLAKGKGNSDDGGEA